MGDGGVNEHHCSARGLREGQEEVREGVGAEAYAVHAVMRLEFGVVAEFEDAWWDFVEGVGEDHDFEFGREEGERMECGEGDEI